MSEAARKLQLADELDVEGRHEAAFPHADQGLGRVLSA